MSDEMPGAGPPSQEPVPPVDGPEAEAAGAPSTRTREGPKGVQLNPGEHVLVQLRPCPSGTWYAYVLTVGLWEFWRRARSYTLTDQRIIEKKGILSKTDNSLPLFYVQDASLRTWFFPRWGRVSVSTAGEVGGFTGTLWLRKEEARTLRQRIVEAAHRSREAQGAAPRQPGGAAG